MISLSWFYYRSEWTDLWNGKVLGGPKSHRILWILASGVQEKLNEQKALCVAVTSRDPNTNFGSLRRDHSGEFKVPKFFSAVFLTFELGQSSLLANE